jgi:hypothetical protein
MKKYTIWLSSFLLLFVLSSCNPKMKKSTSTSTPNSQTTAAMTKSDMLVGKWKFADIHGKEDMDEAGMKMLKSFFGSLKLSFSEDRTYTAFIMGKDDGGNWKLNDSEDKVLMRKSRFCFEEIIKWLRKKNALAKWNIHCQGVSFYKFS